MPPTTAGAGSASGSGGGSISGGQNDEELPKVKFWCGIGVGEDGQVEIHARQEHLNEMKKHSDLTGEEWRSRGIILRGEEKRIILKV